MSFLTDLFEGNVGNLGTDITHAPSSLAAHPDELAETIGGAALVGGGILGLGALGAGEGAGVGADLAAGSELAPGVSVGFDAAGNAIGDTSLLAAGADPAFSGVVDFSGADLTGPSSVFSTANSFGDSGVSSFAPDVLSQDNGSLSSFLSDPAATSGIDTSGGGTQDLTALTADPAATSPVPPAPPSAAPGGFAQTDAELSGGTTGTAPTATAAPSGVAAAGTGGLTSGLGSVMSSPWTKLGLGLAPLALTLARGEPGLTTAGQQAQANANQLSTFGNQQLADAQAGRLNPGQLASLNQMRQDLTNQWKQTFFNMGVQNPEKDTRFAQAMSDVDNKITAATAQMIQQMIQNGLQASGAASGTLIQVANQQMAQDQAFTNNLVSATKALGTTVGGGQTITLKAA